MQDEIRDIHQADRDLFGAFAPIPRGPLRDAISGVLATTVQRHHHVPGTPEQVAYCQWCSEEWPCPDVTAVHTLAQVITRMAEEATTTYLPGRKARP